MFCKLVEDLDKACPTPTFLEILDGRRTVILAETLAKGLGKQFALGRFLTIIQI